MATKKASSTGRAKSKRRASAASPAKAGLVKKKPAAKKPAAKKPAAKKPAAKQTRAAKQPVRRATAKARAVAKVSPLKGTSVTDWVKRLPKEQAAIVGTLLTLAESAAPDAKATIKWAQPVFELNGPFAYIKAAKAHVTLGFWRGTELDDPRGLLGGGDRMKHVRLATLADVDRATLSAWIAEAARLNRTKGDPTKR